MTSISEKMIKPKVGLLELAKQLGNVSQACKVMGYSRDSLYRFKQLYDVGGEESLQEMSRSKPNEKNRVAPHIESAVLELAMENPALGQQRVSNELKHRGILISGGGVRSIWLRHDLETKWPKKVFYSLNHNFKHLKKQNRQKRPMVKLRQNIQAT